MIELNIEFGSCCHPFFNKNGLKPMYSNIFLSVSYSLYKYKYSRYSVYNHNVHIAGIQRLLDDHHLLS